MAGHSKWANIKHRKGAQDKARAKKFAKFSKEIMVAAASGGPDIETNSSLRLAVAKAKAQSMPKKNIESAIAKATGSDSNEDYKEIYYGGNVSGVTFLIKYLASNENKVAAEIQHLFSKAGGSVTGASSVSYVFDMKGVLEIPNSYGDENTIMMKALEAGAEDFETGEDSYFIYTDPSSFPDVKDSLEKDGIENFQTAEVKYLPNIEHQVTKEKAEKILSFIDKLEDEDDIQDVYHNLDANSFND
ncbi:MAG: YebC/PmpR family DNA-binding transcriptional regulator [Mycoplasmatales bacterium]|nr:YebC/PmpR family DNA-binding transcriptional regulator [Mycoplasmatales bacterium]